MSELIMIGRNAAMTTTSEIDAEATDDLTVDEGFVDEAVEGNIDDGMHIEPDFVEGDYIDPGMVEGGYNEGGYMDPGMETGMGMVEVKDPLLSSWPFVMGISVAVLVVSIALGALLAKLKIKKGIDLYED